MEWILIAEIVYIISAVLCAVGIPMVHRKYKNSNSGILSGFIIGLVPILNTMVAIAAVHLLMTNELKVKND